MWTMQRFQDFCVRHFYDAKVEKQHKFETPRSAFIDWVGIEKDMDDLLSQVRIGYDKWMGTVDDSIMKTVREAAELFSFGLYKNKFNLRDEERAFLKKIEDTEQALRRKAAGVKQSDIDKKQKSTESTWAAFDAFQAKKMAEVEAQRKELQRKRERSVDRAMNVQFSLI